MEKPVAGPEGGEMGVGTREAFAQLSAILLNRTGNTQLATLQLAEMDAFDPGGVFEDIFKAGDITEQLMMCSAIRGCTVVIPYLQKVRSTQYQGMQADYPTLAAAALARLGNDVEQNTEVTKAAIKQEKPNYYVLEAAGILRDDATLQILLGRMETDGWDRSESVIRSLGHTRNPAAAKALLDGLETFPLRVWYAIGPAVEELGTDLKDEGIKSDGAGLNATITYIRFAYGAMSPRPDSPSVIRAEHDAAAFMKKHPRLFKKIFSEHPVDNFPKWYNPYAVKLAGLAWTPEATHVLEAIITTDQNKVNDRYRVRRELARLLQEKTGRPYTYVDADGKIKNSEDE